MPIYDSDWSQCGHVVEAILGDPPLVCERCDAPRPARILSPHRVRTSSSSSQETLCCGRSERRSSCVPGSWCGGSEHGGGHP